MIGLNRTVFNSLQEFLDEITLDVANVERKFVRVTRLEQHLGPLPLVAVSLRAGYLVYGRVVELTLELGEAPGYDQERLAELRRRFATEDIHLRERLAAIGLDVRRGYFS